MDKMKIMYISGFLLLTVFGGYYYKDIISGKYLTAPKDVVTHKANDFHIRKYNVKGMSCNDCKVKIEKAVINVPGVLAVDINQKTNEMVVKYKLNQETIKETLSVVKELGFTIGLKSRSGKLQVLDYKITFE